MFTSATFGKKEETEVWKCAVSLSFLLKFVKERFEHIKALTTKEVVDKFIKPDTKDKECCYADLLDSSCVSRPTYFIVHTWGALFLDFVSALQKHFPAGNSTEVYLWIDIFAVNQHKPQFDFDTFQFAIENASGGTIACLDSGGEIFKRVWCLYEIWKTFPDKRLTVVTNVDPILLREQFRGCNVRLAQATIASDKNKIFEEIQKTMSLDEMTQNIKDCLVEGVKLEFTSTQAPSSCQKYALLLECQKKFEEASEYHRKSIEMFKQLNGPEDYTVGIAIALLGNNLDELRKYEESIILFNDAITIFGKELPSIDNSELTLHSLVLIMNKSSNYLQEDLCQQCFSIAEKLVNKHNSEQMLFRLNHLAESLMDEGKHDVALLLVKLQYKMISNDSTVRSGTIINLARILQRMGRHSEALPLFQQLLNSHQKQFGIEHPRTVVAINDLAMLLKSMGRHNEALPLFQQSFKIHQKLFGIEHPGTATSIHNLAFLLESMGKHSEALPLFQQALEIRQKLFGIEHPDTAISINNIATLFKVMGRHSEALPLYQQLLKIRKKLFGVEHPDTATSINNFAMLLESMGKYSEALPLYQQSLEIRQKLFGIEHPDTAISINNLALLLKAMGKYNEALPLFQQSLEIRKKLFGIKHPLTATSINNLATLFQFMEQYRKALPLYQQSLEITCGLFGIEHPDTAISINNLAVILETMGEYTKALPLFQQSLEIRKKLFGIKHPYTANSINNLAALFRSMERYNESLVLFQQSQKIYQDLFGIEHPNTAISINNLADLLVIMERHNEALPLYQQVLKIRQKLYGIDHPYTVAVINNLADLLQRLGRQSEIQKLFNEVSNYKEIYYIDLQKLEIFTDEILGIGAYGKVYCGKYNDSFVAVKEISKTDEQIFSNEMKILKSLHHINIAQCYGYTHKDDSLLIVLEYIRHGRLSDWIEKQESDISLQRIVKILKGIANGMNYLHTNTPQIIHRDFKSPNILIGQNFTIKICDFGLSKTPLPGNEEISNINSTNLNTSLQNTSISFNSFKTVDTGREFIGTIQWAAPEYLNPNRIKERNEKGDIYSFGIVVWELVTRKLPWTEYTSPFDIAGLVTDGERPEIPKDCPLTELIQSCWQDNPQARPSFSEILKKIEVFESM